MRFNREHALGIICIAVAAAVLIITPSFPDGQDGVNLTGPAFFPNIMSYLFIILGIYQIAFGFSPAVQARAADGGSDAGTGVSKRRTVLFISLLAGFVALLEPLGFFPASLLFLFLLMLLFGLSPGRSVLYSVIFVAVIYSLFGILFTIGLPAGILGFLGI